MGTVWICVLLALLSAAIVIGWYYDLTRVKWRKLSSLYHNVEWSAPEGFDPQKIDRAITFAVGALSTAYPRDSIRKLLIGGVRIRVLSTWVIGTRQAEISDFETNTMHVGPSLAGVGEGLGTLLWRWSGEVRTGELSQKHTKAVKQFERFWARVGNREDRS